MDKKKAYQIVCDDLLKIAVRCNNISEEATEPEWKEIYKMDARKALVGRDIICALEALHY